MKHVALSLLVAACGTLTASALNATNAQIWLSEKAQPEFVSVEGSSFNSDKYKSEDAFKRTWQYVSIPLHVEGKAKGGATPHYIHELKVRITLAVEATDDKGKALDGPEILSKDITYVDIPLSKNGDSMVNVGVFVSPSNAYKLSPKDGSLEKRLIAVAVEGTFEGSNCNGAAGEKSEHSKMKMEPAVVVNAKAAKDFPGIWWKKQRGKSGAVLSAISETPFAHKYASYGFPASNPIFGSDSGSGSSSVSSAISAVTGAVSGSTLGSGGPVGGPVSSEPAVISGPVGDDGATETEEEDASKKGKKSKKDKKDKKARR